MADLSWEEIKRRLDAGPRLGPRVRTLTRAEVAAAFPGVRISADYGRPKPAYADVAPALPQQPPSETEENGAVLRPQSQHEVPRNGFHF
jgi:hypothetical protein